MNRKNLQLDVCRQLLNPNNRCSSFMINENEIAITTTGYDVFIFDVAECIFDISKIRQAEVVAKVCEDNEQDVCIKRTDELFKCGDMLLEKYEAEGTNLVVYVNSAYSKKFSHSGVVFFAHSPLNRILVKDAMGRKIGAFLPVRFIKQSEMMKAVEK